MYLTGGSDDSDEHVASSAQCQEHDVTSLRTSLRTTGAAVAAFTLATVLAVSGQASASTPVSAGPESTEPTGPALTVPQQTLDEAVNCTPDVHPGSGKKPVVLVGGVGFDPADAWGWGYSRALARDGYGVCEVTIPDSGRGDATIGAEYVVNAVRHAQARSGQKVSIVAHSAGPALSLWALRFWPDVAASVDDMVSLAGPIHGAHPVNLICSVGFCPVLAHQLSMGSEFIAALNRDPISPSVSVTSIFTLFDEGIQPAREVSSYPGAANIALQDHCPGRFVEHIGLMYDAATYRLALDALSNPGPAVPARIPNLCEGIALPGFDIATFLPSFTQGAIKYLGILGQPSLPAEPALPRYAEQG